MTVLPNALAIGPLKTGTSWLHDFLMWRGDVCLPYGVKETFFFDRYYAKGMSWYGAHFRHYDRTKHLKIMEVAPGYFHSPDAPMRIAQTLGNIRILVTLRDPVKRSWSHYLHLRRYGHTRAPFREAVREHSGIIEASRYATQLERWKRKLGAEQIGVVICEDLIRDFRKYATDICEILQLPLMDFPQSLAERKNAAAVSPSYLLAFIGRRTADFLRKRRLYPVINWAKRIGLKSLFFGRAGHGPLPQRLSEGDQEWLRSQLGDEIGELERLLGRDLSLWKSARIVKAGVGQEDC